VEVYGDSVCNLGGLFYVWLPSYVYAVLGVVIGAEYVFLIPEVIKIIWFMAIETDPNYHDIRAFYPLSLMHFFDYYSIDKRWAYPLRALNVWEIAYWFLLVSGIHHYARKERKIVWLIVACSYILLFLMWIVFYLIVYK
jgi:hypothetical protein